MRRQTPYGGILDLQEVRISGSPIGGAWPILYGRAKVHCPIVHLHVRNALQIELAAVVSLGEIDAIEKVFVEEEEVYPTSRAWCRVELFTGTLTQDKSTLLTHSSWMTALPGVAYVAMLVYTSQAPISGLPRISVVARGRKCGPSNSYTTNPVWHLYDLLTSTEYGARVVTSNWTSVASQVSTPAALYLEAYGSASLDDPAIRALLQLIHGRLYWQDTAATLALDSAATNVGTASFDGPIRILEDIEVRASIGESPNAVRGRYLEPSNWTERQVVVLTDAASKGQVRTRWLDLGYIPAVSYRDAMRVARTALNRAQSAFRSVKLTCDGTAWDCWPGTRITVNATPLSGTEMLITERRERPDGRIELECIPWSSTDFDTSTYTAPSETEPTTASTSEIILSRDDFASGGTASGAVGELGWLITGSCAVSYPDVPGRYGVLGLITSGNTTDYLSLPSSLATPYTARIVVRPNTNGTPRFAIGSLLASYGPASTTWTVSYSGTTIASLTAGTSDWVEISVAATSSTITATISKSGASASGTYNASIAGGQPKIYNGVANNQTQWDLVELAMQR